MKFSFGQIYPEVNTDYDVTSKLLHLLCNKLNNLNKEIKHFNKVFEGEDYSLVLIISATRNKDILEVKGPIVLKKRKEVEFALHIPYRELPNRFEETLYVLNNIYQSIVFVFNKYKADLSGLEENIDQVINAVKTSPSQFCNEQ